MNASQEQEKLAPEIVSRPESNQQPIWHVIVLNVFTMFGYSLIWFCKNCSQLATLAGKIDSGEIVIDDQPSKTALQTLRKINPILFTLGLLLPAIQMVLTTIFFTTAVRLYPAQHPLLKRHPWLAGMALTLLMVGLLCLGSLPGFLFLAYMTAAIPLAIAQNMLNAFWKNIESEEEVVRLAFSGGELFMLICGSVLLGLVVTGLVNH